MTLIPNAVFTAEGELMPAWTITPLIRLVGNLPPDTPRWGAGFKRA